MGTLYLSELEALISRRRIRLVSPRDREMVFRQDSLFLLFRAVCLFVLTAQRLPILNGCARRRRLRMQHQESEH